MSLGEALLGREQQARRLHEAIERATRGTRSLTLVSGVAGIGKSALVRSVVADHALVGWGTCVEAVATPGYWPWTRALDAVARAAGREVALAAAAEDAPLLASIGRTFGRPATAAGTEGDRLLLMDAVSRWLAQVASASGTVVVVLDDLQWADESSLSLLEFVARDPTPAPVAIVGCFRDDELTTSARGRLSHLAMSATSIELRGLDREAVAALAVEVAGPIPDEQVDELFRRAGGHPVFTRELALLSRDGAAQRLPLAVRDAIERRLAALPSATRSALEVAALAGNTIAPDDVAAATGTSAAEVSDALAAARTAGIVVVDAALQLHFAHDLYRETIAAAVPAERRVQIHRRLGSSFETRSARGDDVHPADLARHFALAVPAGEAARAARWALAAASADVAALAFSEAAEHLRRWRDAVQGSPDVEARDRLAVLLAEADALARSGEVEVARTLLRSARALAEPEELADLRAQVALAFADLGARAVTRRDDVIRVLEDALAAVGGRDADLEARITARLARELHHSVAADRPRAEPLSERALDLGRFSASPATLIDCLLARHDVRWGPGEAAERIALAKEIVAVAERSGDDERLAEGKLLLANALLESGSAAFEPALEDCLGLLDQLGLPGHRYTAATRRAAMLLLRGRLDAAETAIEDAADLGSVIREPDVDNVRMAQRLELVRARSRPTNSSTSPRRRPRTGPAPPSSPTASPPASAPVRATWTPPADMRVSSPTSAPGVRIATTCGPSACANSLVQPSHSTTASLPASFSPTSCPSLRRAPSTAPSSPSPAVTATSQGSSPGTSGTTTPTTCSLTQ